MGVSEVITLNADGQQFVRDLLAVLPMAQRKGAKRPAASTAGQAFTLALEAAGATLPQWIEEVAKAVKTENISYLPPGDASPVALQPLCVVSKNNVAPWLTALAQDQSLPEPIPVDFLKLAVATLKQMLETRAREEDAARKKPPRAKAPRLSKAERAKATYCQAYGCEPEAIADFIPWLQASFQDSGISLRQLRIYLACTQHEADCKHMSAAELEEYIKTNYSKDYSSFVQNLPPSELAALAKLQREIERQRSKLPPYNKTSYTSADAAGNIDAAAGSHGVLLPRESTATAATALPAIFEQTPLTWAEICGAVDADPRATSLDYVYFNKALDPAKNPIWQEASIPAPVFYLLMEHLKELIPNWLHRVPVNGTHQPLKVENKWIAITAERATPAERLSVPLLSTEERSPHAWTVSIRETRGTSSANGQLVLLGGEADDSTIRAAIGNVLQQIDRNPTLATNQSVAKRLQTVWKQLCPGMNLD